VKQFISFRSLSIILIFIVTIIYSCSKGGGGTPAPDPCAGVTITVTGSVTNPTTGANNGSISASASGGSSGFTYSINGGAFQASGSFSNLPAGAYTVAAKNTSGCTGSATFTLVATNPCAGVTIVVGGTSINPTSTLTSNGSISATASGSSGFTFNLNGGTFQSSGNFSNLAAGNYTVIAKDINGCTGSQIFTLTAPNPCTGITIIVTGTIVNPTSAVAANGSIAATASGSTGFTYNINGGTFQSTGNFINLAAGNYTVIAKDINGCTGSQVFTLTAPNPCAGVTITVSNVVVGNRPCETANGSITSTGAGGTGPYTYNINGGAFQSSNLFSGLSAAVYSISAKDANGCIGTVNATVNNVSAGPLFLAVQNVLNNNCIGCHNNTLSEGGMNWTIDCNIVNFKDRINARAVNGNPSAMPPTGLLPASERTKITNWINAGGRFTD
jgi:SprB repeat